MRVGHTRQREARVQDIFRKDAVQISSHAITIKTGKSPLPVRLLAVAMKCTARYAATQQMIMTTVARHMPLSRRRHRCLDFSIRMRVTALGKSDPFRRAFASGDDTLTL